jgi:hypothetical protein
MLDEKPMVDESKVKRSRRRQEKSVRIFSLTAGPAQRYKQRMEKWRRPGTGAKTRLAKERC